MERPGEILRSGEIGEKNIEQKFLWYLVRATSLHPITAANFGFVLDIAPHQVREIVSRLRKNGHLVCSRSNKPAGYWIAENLEQAQDWLGRNRHRIMEQLQAYSGFKRSMLKKAGDGWNKEHIKQENLAI